MSRCFERRFLHIKGLSPLVATILLIAIVVAIGGVIFMWLGGFAGETTKKISKEAGRQVECEGGNIVLEALRYCNTNQYLRGLISNKGSVDLENVTFRIDYPNAPSTLIQLCAIDNIAINCTAGNLTLTVYKPYWFNLSVEEGFNKVVVIVPSCPSVYDTVETSDVIISC